MQAATTYRATAIAISLFIGHLGSAQWLGYPTPGLPRKADGKVDLSAPAPRMPDGKPDFNGAWTRISPKYGRNIAADLKPEDIKPWALDHYNEAQETLEKGYMNVWCLPLGPGYTTAADSTGVEVMKILQTPREIAILNEDLTYRQIFMDGRPLEKDPNPTWMGYSVGRWEGDTLVVESGGYNDKTWLDHSGHPHTDKLHVTERYRRPDLGHLDIEVTISDPGAYNRDFTVKVAAVLAVDTELLEIVCAEGNTKPLSHWIGTAADERNNEAKVPLDVLQSYVGAYGEVAMPKIWRNAPRSLIITVENGHLIGNMDGRGPQQLIAHSNTEFAGLYGLGVEFATDKVGGLFVKHVSGNYRFLKK